MAKEEKPVKAKGGCLGGLVTLFLLVMALGLGTALFFVSQPQDMSDIKGYGVQTGAPKRDIKSALQGAVDRGFDLSLSEAEINGWLKQTLEAKQGGLLEKQVELKGVAVRLRKDVAEVIMERTVFGQPMTVSMFLRIEQNETPAGVTTALHRDGGPYHEMVPQLKKGGRFGQLVVPQGLLLLVMPSFAELGSGFSEEIKLGFEQMARVTVSDGTLILDPREKSSGLERTF